MPKPTSLVLCRIYPAGSAISELEFLEESQIAAFERVAGHIERLAAVPFSLLTTTVDDYR